MPAQNSLLHCFLYRSHLASNTDIACVGDIVRTARAFNKTQGITGILVFDGQQFCQYVEGPQPALSALIDQIGRDPRHTRFTPLHSSECPSPRRFASWAMAYVLTDDEDDADPLASLSRLEGTCIIEKLQALIPKLDMA
ncbi:MAG: BLUF domain-containing protein [Comamonas sp.]|nr:BLUF domain-containing protein [Comamonas sp.]